jgi:hypothetical protein
MFKDAAVHLASAAGALPAALETSLGQHAKALYDQLRGLGLEVRAASRWQCTACCVFVSVSVCVCVEWRLLCLVVTPQGVVAKALTPENPFPLVKPMSPTEARRAVREQANALSRCVAVGVDDTHCFALCSLLPALCSLLCSHARWAVGLAEKRSAIAISRRRWNDTVRSVRSVPRSATKW